MIAQRLHLLNPFLAVLLPLLVAANSTAQDTSVGDLLVAKYFQSETAKLTAETAARLSSAEDWKSEQTKYRRQLQEMLGLHPMPARTPLHAKVVGTIQHDEFVVERLHFQSKPGLYVAANLYRPKVQSAPLPAVLYVCGHGRSMTDGRSNGNKAAYQHHGAWFARNGFVCLTIDTIQLGEFPGIHHGTYREGMWWWNNRGYSSAGVEAWNSIRALDYLETRSEVDKTRLAVTGRSGGGAYSWWVAALDERIKAAVPVAGITSLHNHVVDGCVEGHCDCMYMVNTYRWDYPMVAALVAPRALLISNTDKDRIFPLTGVVDVHSKTAKLYAQLDAANKLGLHITEGPHKDTQELRVHAFRWLNRWLKKDDALIASDATKFFEPEQLRVFDKLPQDEIVTTVHETFVPLADATLPNNKADLESASARWMSALTEKVFRSWPTDADSTALAVKLLRKKQRDGILAQQYAFNSDSTYRLPFYVLRRSGPNGQPPSVIKDLQITVVDRETWDNKTRTLIASLFGDALQGDDSLPNLEPQTAHILFAPRGIGPTQWSRNERTETHIRRRFMQLGQTAATMQIWDLRRMLESISHIDELSNARTTLSGTREAATIAMYASLFATNVDRLSLTNPPDSNRTAPDLLNVSRFVRMPQLVMLAADRVERLQLSTTAGDQEAWKKVAEHPLVKNKMQLVVAGSETR